MDTKGTGQNGGHPLKKTSRDLKEDTLPSAGSEVLVRAFDKKGKTPLPQYRDQKGATDFRRRVRPSMYSISDRLETDT